MTPLPEAYPEGCSPAEVTLHSMDSTYTLEKIISQYNKYLSFYLILVIQLLIYFCYNIVSSFDK